MKILSLLSLLLVPLGLLGEVERSILDVIRQRVENSRYQNEITNEEGKKLYYAGTDKNGNAVYSEYGNRMIDEGIEALKEYEKPWTIPNLIEQLDTSLNGWLQNPTKTELKNEGDLIYLLLSSQDKRAYELGVKYRKFPALQVRTLAYMGLHDYYFKEEKAHTYKNGWAGGLQGMILNVNKWIEARQEKQIESEPVRAGQPHLRRRKSENHK